MKKFLYRFVLAVCVITVATALTACGSATKWLQPTVAYDGDEFTVKFMSNAEGDFELPIEGLKFEHSRYENENILEYTWVIYKGDELVGWLELGNGYDTYNKKKPYVYGFGASYNNDVYCYSDTTFLVVLKSKDLSVFDNLKFTTDIGAIEKTPETFFSNPMPATERFVDYNDQSGNSTPKAGAENFVCCMYSLTISDIDPNKGPRTINIKFSFED